MGLVDRIARRLGWEPTADITRAPKTVPSYANAIRVGVQGSGTQKRGSKQLRNFAENNEWVRVAVNRRKHALGQANWRIVRIDDPKATPSPAVVKKIRDLFRFVNPKRESFRSLLDQVVEDILVLDAGCVEKEKTAGGGIAALWVVDGAEISVDPKWNGSKPNAPRYSQWENFRKICDLRNDELIYMMHNPRSHTPIGWSPVETLVRVIEAELYGENYDYEGLKQTAPEGLIDLGRGVPAKEVVAFREYYESEIAGTKSMAIFGGGGDSGVTGEVKFTPFKWSPREAQRQEYKKWLATKIAAVFEMDLLSFNLTEDVNRANGENLTTQTDTGLVGLSSLVAEYITREIIWEIDENHGFEFADVIATDDMIQAKVDQLNMGTGITFPNEIRAREGLDPVAWGNVPYAVQSPQGGSGSDGKAAAKDFGPFFDLRVPPLTRKRNASSYAS